MYIPKIFSNIVVLVILIALGYRAWQFYVEVNSPAYQSNLESGKFTVPIESSSSTIRWNHFPLTVYIDDSFIERNPEYTDNVREALELWETASNNLVSFTITTSSSADIVVEWTASLKEKSTDTLGNTDLKFINVSNFGVIQDATIEMLTRTNGKQLNEIDMTNLALHEIGHAIGLKHSSDGNDIMYPTLEIPSSSIKEISQEDIQKLTDLYKLPTKADLIISEVNVTKATLKRVGKTFYLINISTVMENIGLTDVDLPELKIETDNEILKEEVLPPIPIGNKLTLNLGNVMVENNFTEIRLTIDPKNSVDELNEGNNFVKLSVVG